LPTLHDGRPPRGRARAPAPTQLLHVVDSPPRGRRALSNFGEVVATGVKRPDAADHRRDRSRGFARGPQVGYCTWIFLAGWVGEAWYERCVELTRRLYGL
jgi:hypothetical protein